MKSTYTRRSFAARFAGLFSSLGIATAGLSARALASPAKHDDNSIKKMKEDGTPSGPKEVITPVVVHNGMIFVSGVGAHDSRDEKEWTIDSHTQIVMDKIKKNVENGGGTMDTVLQANVFLVKIEHWDGMHKVFATYFPDGGPSRTTVAVAALPGNSLVEINCIAAVAKK
jgi:2-iminobutanoate/2-iminopropanoate deaminase